MAITNESGMKYAKLVCVSTKNNNKFYEMIQIDDSSFRANWGRVEGNVSTKNYPMNQWDKIYRDKTVRKDEPYTDMSEIMATPIINEGETEMFSKDRPKDIVKFIEKLISYQKDSIKKNYTVNATQVTESQIAAAQKALDDIINKMKVGSDIEEINKMLVHYYRIIPRKMKKVQDHLVQSLKNKTELKKAFDDILTIEQDALDAMSGQVSTTTAQKDEDKKDGVQHDGVQHDLMQSLGVEMSSITKAEETMIKNMLGGDANRFVQAFRVNLNHTSEAYDAWIKNTKNKKSALLWHGSRNENWWNIIQKGLLIRPSGVVLTASMFGNGIYFADKAKKSIGYTSARGSYWAKGNSEKAYLALYDIHQGDQLEILNWKSEHSSLDYSKIQAKGKDSVFAKGGADLINNEFIVYQTVQCTIRYIIEIE